MAMIRSIKVSVMEEWHKNLQSLKRTLLKIPKPRPTAREPIASAIKEARISKGVFQSKVCSPEDPVFFLFSA